MSALPPAIMHHSTSLKNKSDNKSRVWHEHLRKRKRKDNEKKSYIYLYIILKEIQ